MKVAIFTILLGLAGMANAGTVSAPSTSLLSATSGTSAPSFQAAKRKTSTHASKGGKSSRHAAVRRK